MASHYVAHNVSNPVLRLFVRGILILRGHPVILTGRRDIQAAQAKAGVTVVAV